MTYENKVKKLDGESVKKNNQLKFANGKVAELLEE